MSRSFISLIKKKKITKIKNLLIGKNTLSFWALFLPSLLKLNINMTLTVSHLYTADTKQIWSILKTRKAIQFLLLKKNQIWKNLKGLSSPKFVKNLKNKKKEIIISALSSQIMVLGQTKTQKLLSK